MLGLNPKNLSTSNLYEPNPETVCGYLEDSLCARNKSLVNLFEERFAAYHNAQYCVSFSTGFWALVAAILCKCIEGKNHIIMPSMTYRRLADVVCWTGKIPFFVDIEADSLAISPAAIKKSITNETGLILAVHPIVNCCDVMDILELGKEFSVPTLFDAVESVHETYRGKRIGSFGVGEVFSLHASKLINGVEGGYVCTDDSQFEKKLRSVKKLSTSKIVPIGIQGDINPLHCGIALAGLDELSFNISHNQTIYLAYKTKLNALDGIKLLEFDPLQQTSFKNIVVEVEENCPLNRDELVKQLNELNIFARPHYYPPLHQKKMAYKTLKGDLSISNLMAPKFLNLPCGQRFTVDLVDVVVDSIRSLINKRAS